MEKNRDKTDKRLKNLKTDAGPGRPLGQKNYATLYREALIKLAKLNDKEPEELELEILSKGIMNARAGDYRFYKDILDRLHGQAIQKSDITSGGDKIVFMPPELLDKHKLDDSHSRTINNSER